MKEKHGVLIYTCSDKAFKGTVVNLALPSLHGGLLEIARTVPLKNIVDLKSKNEKLIGMKMYC